MSAPTIQIGTKYGRLAVVERASGTARARWLCRCDCGAERVVFGYNLRSGATASCGCLRAEMVAEKNRAKAPHGLTRSPTHKSYWAMISRCEQPGNASFARYGGAGVKVCARWRESFTAFVEDVGLRPAGTTLDRIENTKGYEPGNCRWATPKEQARNRRPPRLGL